jgi:hypothetical protein
MKVLKQTGGLKAHLVKLPYHLVALIIIAGKRCFFASETLHKK